MLLSIDHTRIICFNLSEKSGYWSSVVNPPLALPRENRLKRGREIKSVFKEGRFLRGNFLFVKMNNNNLARSRFSIGVSSKQYKKATDRNRIKRVLVECIKERSGKLREGIDVAIIIQQKAEEEDLKKDLLVLLNRSKLIKRE